MPSSNFSCHSFPPLRNVRRYYKHLNWSWHFQILKMTLVDWRDFPKDSRAITDTRLVDSSGESASGESPPNSEELEAPAPPPAHHSPQPTTSSLPPEAGSPSPQPLLQPLWLVLFQDSFSCVMLPSPRARSGAAGLPANTLCGTKTTLS